MSLEIRTPLRKLFDSAWTGDRTFDRFVRDPGRGTRCSFKEILDLRGPSYDILLGTVTPGTHKQLYLFNHGIYVGHFDVTGLSYHYCICVNIHADLVDLHISREDVIENTRWRGFIGMVFRDVLRALEEKCGPNHTVALIRTLSRMTEPRLYLDCDRDSDLIEQHPFIKTASRSRTFPPSSERGRYVLERCETSWVLTICQCTIGCSRSLAEEMDIVLATLRGIRLSS